MNAREIRNTMQCLSLMCKDLNDFHANYDIPTGVEDATKALLTDAIDDFNKSQHTWVARLVNTRTGWVIKYE